MNEDTEIDDVAFQETVVVDEQLSMSKVRQLRRHRFRRRRLQKKNAVRVNLTMQISPVVQVEKSGGDLLCCGDRIQYIPMSGLTQLSNYI